MKTISVITAATTLGLATLPAQAAYVVNVQQVGADVVMTGSGSLNLAAATLTGNGTTAIGVAPASSVIVVGTTGAYASYDVPTMSGPTDFGPGNVTVASAGTGPVTGMGYVAGSAGILAVPVGYVSGSALGVSTATFSGATFASLGMTEGSFVWTWGSGNTADSFTINIGNANGAVPEPATWAMMIAGFGLIGGAMRRRTTARIRFA